MIDVVMPQMGESIAEGTVIKWMKKVGDKVERDEPLFEISTDKVDAEIPSPGAGTVAEIIAQEGQTVAVNSVVARLAGEGEAAQPSAGAAAPAPAAAAPAPAAPEAPKAAAATATQPEAAGTVAAPQPSGAAPQVAQQQGQPAEAENVTSLEERRRTKSSPLVRKIAKENNIDVAQVEGSGMSGRVTKKDILEYIESPKPKQVAAAAGAPRPATREVHAPAPLSLGGADRTEAMSVMRRRISDHMVMSKRTSAHVTTVFEFDFTNIDRLRKRYKASYAERGAKLTYLPFITQAISMAIREFPILNSSVDGDNIVYRGEVNLGIAVALDWGLIVPVVKKADEKSILGLAKTINELGERARTKKLSPEDVQGGTFTITNPGVYGGLFGTPIINQPQVAIFGVGGVHKRPAVIESEDGDSIAIRSMCICSLTFDHRIIDGAIADQFMARIREIIEAAEYQM